MLPGILAAQDTIVRKSIHQVESEEHSLFIPVNKAVAQKILGATTKKTSKVVFGYHPYWASKDAYTQYDYSMLTHICYFSYDLDTSDGSYKSLHGFDKTPLTEYAHENNTKVILGVTNFGYAENDALLLDTLKQLNFIKILSELLAKYHGDGVNLDLELIRGSRRDDLTAFVRRLHDSLKSRDKNYEISLASPAVDWAGAWDFKGLSPYIDYFMIMCYDYYWSGSEYAGPVSPLEGYNYNVTRTINTYLDSGAPPGNILMGLPWYGQVWPVEDNKIHSKTTGKATAYIYSTIKQKAGKYDPKRDAGSGALWFSYQESGQWYQGWFDDSLSLSMKYALVNKLSLAGIGIWTISYALNEREIWDGIGHAFGTGTLVDEYPANDIPVIYPDPAVDFIFVKYPATFREAVRVDIYDIYGRLCLSKKSPVQTGEIRIYIENLPSGGYFIRAASNKNVIFGKFIKK